MNTYFTIEYKRRKIRILWQFITFLCPNIKRLDKFNAREYINTRIHITNPSEVVINFSLRNVELPIKKNRNIYFFLIAK